MMEKGYFELDCERFCERFCEIQSLASYQRSVYTYVFDMWREMVDTR